MKKFIKVVFPAVLLFSALAMTGCNFNAEEEIAGHSFRNQSSVRAVSSNQINGTAYDDYTYTFNEDGTFSYVWRTVITSDGSVSRDSYKSEIKSRIYEGSYEIGLFAIKFSGVTLRYPVQYVLSDGTVKEDSDDEGTASTLSDLIYSIRQNDGTYYLYSKGEGTEYQRLD